MIISISTSQTQNITYLCFLDNHDIHIGYYGRMWEMSYGMLKRIKHI